MRSVSAFLAGLRHPPSTPTQTPSPDDAQLEALVRRILSKAPAGTTLTLHAPLQAARLGLPVRHDFCPQCGLDIFENPGLRVTHLPQDPRDPVRVQCDCGLAFEGPAKAVFL